MTLQRVYPVWRRASDLPVYQSMGRRPVQYKLPNGVWLTDPKRTHEPFTEFHAWRGRDYVEGVKLTWRLFDVSDIENRSAAVCPCGDAIYAGTELGELVDDCERHIREVHGR